MYNSSILNHTRRSVLCTSSKYISSFFRNHSINSQCIKHRPHNLKYVYKTNSSSLRLLSEIKAIKCWKCGIEKKSILELFCDQCNVIQSPHEKENYFKIFGLPDTFDIDSKSLTQKFRAMQSVLHPDKFSNKSDKEKAISEDYSSLVNKAYSILQSPLKRAIHLLAIRGETIHEDQKLENPEFLMEIMELNEEVEEASTPEKLKQLNVKNKRQLEVIEKDISKYFESGDIQNAKQQILKMKYYWSVASHINRLLRERGIAD